MKRNPASIHKAILQRRAKTPDWAKCFLEHAARETAWASENSKACNYIAAHENLIRRGVWLHAALLAQEAGK